jgi:hypothetical protein
VHACLTSLDEVFSLDLTKGSPVKTHRPPYSAGAGMNVASGP